MGVKVYRVKPFQHPQENAAFETLCWAAEEHLRDLEDVRIIGNIVYPGGQMDVLVLARHSVTIIDFKDWSGTITVRRTRPWVNQEGKIVLGGSYANPFEQMCAYRETLQSSFVRVPALRGNDFSHVNALVLFTQPVELLEDPEDPFGPLVLKWFHVADWTSSIHMLRNAASPRIDLPSELLDAMVADLEAVPFVPMTRNRLVPQSAVFDALQEEHYARMAEWELEHRDEINAQYDEARAGWDRMDFPKRT